MPRPPRLILPGVPLHLVQRGNNRIPVFIAQDECRTYLEFLHVTSASTHCAVHAYVLMTNHVHLLITPAEATSAARLMQALSQGYARWFNRRHGRTGTLWEGRYHSSVVDAERYLLVCSRYIELNPVRARIVRRPEDYPWSSHRANAWGRADALLTHHPCFNALGSTDSERHAAYRAVFAESPDEVEFQLIRDGTALRGAVGPPDFHALLEGRIGRRRHARHHGGDRRSSRFRDGRRSPADGHCGASISPSASNRSGADVGVIQGA